jgi:hypothetical protein
MIIFILIIHFIIAFISGCLFLPNTSNDNKSEDKIEEDKVYSELFLKHFLYVVALVFTRNNKKLHNHINIYNILTFYKTYI